MSIATFDQWIAGAKQIIPFSKTVARTTIANAWFTILDVAGNPGAGTLAAGNTANGAVPTDATAGFPPINFSTGAGYLSDVDYGSTVACRLAIFDRVFHSGAHNFNATDTLASQPSFGARMPGSSYVGTQIWYECVTAITTNQVVTVTYTNQAGVAGRTTGAQAFGVAPTLGRLIQLPLQAGDSGVQKIESVTSTGATVGTFNILVLRPLWSGRVTSANAGDCHGPDRTGMPQLYSDSALMVAVNADSTSSGAPDLAFMIASG
jgi:hypothetical protein